MTEKNIEVEIKSFITKEDYDRLLKFFRENASLVKEDFQETHYFDCPGDVRIQKNNSQGKIIMKRGRIHDEQREESEVFFPRDQFDKIKTILGAAGLCTKIKWMRKRKEFDWDNITVCLDYTKGYGYIIELEKMSSKEEKEEALFELEKKFKELNIPLTSREKFEQKFNHYKENWRMLIENE